MFYIPTNMTPSEAVNQFEELQVHPDIAKWADDSESLQEVSEDFYKIEALVKKLNVKGENAVIKNEILKLLER